MTIRERIEKRVENGRRIVNEITKIDTEIKALQVRRDNLLAEAIGNNEALKELREIQGDK